MTAHAGNVFFSNNDTFETYPEGATQRNNEQFLPVRILLYASTPRSIQRFDNNEVRFNASAKASNGSSLDDCLLIYRDTGPKQQPDLF